jgi:DNA-binding IclR family transcriptional regulator
VRRPVAPLLFFQGGYGGFTPRSFMVPTDQELASGVTLAQEVRSSMELLAEEIGAEVTAFARIGSDVATVATAAGKDMGTTAVLGARFPLMPPLGELFVAWEDQAEVDAWVARAFGADEETQSLFRSRLETARRKGWALSFHSGSADNDLLEAMRDYGRGELTPARQRAVAQTIVSATDRYRVDTLEAGQTYDVDAIMAPVRNAAGTVQLVLRLSQLPSPATSERVQAWARQLTSAANEASARIAKAG